MKVSKVIIASETVDFLGMHLTREGWSISKKYKAAVEDMLKPTSLKELRSLFGVANWQWRFMPPYTELVAPLQQMVKSHTKDVERAWTAEMDRTLGDIKTALQSNVVLAHPNFSLPFYVHADASELAVGAILIQRDPDTPSHIQDPGLRDDERILGFYSRKLTVAGQHYSVPEKEALAIVCDTEHFRPFIFGYTVTVFTDQRSLIWLMEYCHPSKYTRYRERLAPFNLTIKYISGKCNPADYLSRWTRQIKTQQAILSIVESTWSWETDQRQLDFETAVTQAMEGRSQQLVTKHGSYALEGVQKLQGHWRQQSRVLLEAAVAEQLVQFMHHEPGILYHAGITRTAHYFAKYLWPELSA